MSASDSHATGRLTSLFDQLGGAPVIRTTLENFNRRVLADPKLARLFATANLQLLEKSEARFFTTALGGPARLPVGRIPAALPRRPIGERFFRRIVGHLSASLSAAHVPTPLRQPVMTAVATLMPEIIHVSSRS